MYGAKVFNGAEGQTRTVDTGIFSAVLYHLSYLGSRIHYQIWAYALSRRIYPLYLTRISIPGGFQPVFNSQRVKCARLTLALGGLEARLIINIS